MAIYKDLFSKIAEPKTARLLQFVIYLMFLFVGVYTAIDRPDNLENVIGQGLLLMFSLFVVSGSLLGLFAILPGIWWLERAGIILLNTGLLMYLIMIVYSDASLVGITVVSIMVISKVQRWFEIKDWALAPRKD